MNISGAMAARMLARGFQNKLQNKPLSISFEITHSCTANSWHCNWGGPIKETRLSAEEYAAIQKDLRPVVSHVSGGEPLARGDVYEIVEKLSNPGKLPFMIVVSNASNLNEQRFRKLQAAGMDQLSISLDFPDERHDDFGESPVCSTRCRGRFPIWRRSPRRTTSCSTCASRTGTTRTFLIS